MDQHMLSPQGAATGLNVKDLGAAGDGSTDDTDAVQAAIDRGGITFFPPGDYCCRTLTMRAATRLAGANSGTYRYQDGAYVDAYPMGTVSRIIRKPGTNRPLILGPAGATRVILEDLELDGNNLMQTAGQAHVVSLSDSHTPEDTQWVISRCYLHGRSDPHAPDWGNGGSNLYIGARRMACRVLHSTSNFAHHHGIEVNGADTLVDGCIIGDNGAHGIVIGAWAATITNSAIYNNTNGIHVTDTGDSSPKRILITTNGIDRNRQSGILLDGTATSGAAGVSIANNGFTSNSTDADGGAAHIDVRTGSGQVAIGGNAFSVLEDGYRNRTSAALRLAEGATALDLGNLYEGDSVADFTNAPTRLRRSTAGT
jgi:hypothetical protein